MRASAAASHHAPTRKAYVLGGHVTKFIGKGHPDFIHKKHPDFGKRTNPELKDYIFESVRVKCFLYHLFFLTSHNYRVL